MERLLPMSNFIKDHPIAAPVGALGGALTVLAHLNDAYSFVTSGLPNGLWAALGASVFVLSMFAVVAKQHRVLKRTILSVPTGGGPDPPQGAPTQSAVPWNDEAHLILVFDKAMKNAKAVAQDNVPYYYWYTLHEMQIEFDTEKFTATPCGTIVFLSFQYPTHTSYNRVYVGNGIQWEVLGQNPYGATVWVTGDLRGRAVDIRFSKTPILTG